MSPPRPRWLYLFAILVMVATTLPYLMGYANAGEAWRFTGFVFGVEDGNSYIAKMLGGATGEWLFRTPYTAIPQRGVVAFLPYLLLGKLTAPPAQHAQLVALFHLFRFGAGFLAILATYDFIALFNEHQTLRRWGVALASLGGGLGWVLLLLGENSWLGWLPLEFYSPESFGFLAIYGLPHLAMSRALLLWGLRAYLVGDIVQGKTSEVLKARRPRRSLLAGAYWLIMGFFQPLSVVVAWGVVGAHLLFLGIVNVVSKSSAQGQKSVPVLRAREGSPDPEPNQPNRKIFSAFTGICRSLWSILTKQALVSSYTSKVRKFQLPSWKSYFRSAVVAGLISSPIVVYTLVRFNTDPFLSSWTAQNTITSPPLPHYLLAYGVLLPFIVFGIRRTVHSGEDRDWLPVAWAFILPLFVYAPYNLQRRLAEGVWVALVILALKALDNLPEKKRGRWSWAFTLAFPSTLVLLAGGMMAVRTPAEPLYRPAAEVAAFQYLAQNTEVDAVVLSSRQTGNPLPAWAPVQVVAGHGPETVNAKELLPRVRAFYHAGTSEETRLALLDEYHVDYVFHGPAERDLGDWNPLNADYLTPVYEDGGYIIFETQSRESRE